MSLTLMRAVAVMNLGVADPAGCEIRAACRS